MNWLFVFLVNVNLLFCQSSEMDTINNLNNIFYSAHEIDEDEWNSYLYKAYSAHSISNDFDIESIIDSYLGVIIGAGILIVGGIILILLYCKACNTFRHSDEGEALKDKKNTQYFLLNNMYKDDMVSCLQRRLQISALQPEIDYPEWQPFPHSDFMKEIIDRLEQKMSSLIYSNKCGKKFEVYTIFDNQFDSYMFYKQQTPFCQSAWFENEVYRYFLEQNDLDLKNLIEESKSIHIFYELESRECLDNLKAEGYYGNNGQKMSKYMKML